MKKFRLFIISIISVILIGLVIINQNKIVSSDNRLIKEPDKILIYNNKIIEIKNDNDEFYGIFELVCKRINSKSFFGETAIENEIIDEIKADFAIEFIYFKEEILYFKKFSRPYKRLFISLSEEYNDCIVLYAQDRYQSSPLENLNKSDQLKKYVDRIVLKSKK